MEIVQTLSNEISEEIEDINFEIGEDNPKRKMWEDNPSNREFYNRNLKLRISDSSKLAIIEQLSIDDIYMSQMITIDGSRIIYKQAIKGLKRLCSYLSNKHNIELDVIYIFDTYVISNKKLTSIMDWIFFFEFRYSEPRFNTFDASILTDYESLSTLYNKWNMLGEMNFLFRYMTSSYKNSWQSTILFNGLFIYTSDEKRILIFKFNRGNNIGENMKYNVDIYFDTVSTEQKSKPLPQMIGKCDFKKVENINLSFDVYDKESTTEKIYKLLVEKTIHYFQIEKIKLLYKIHDVLRENNDFFSIEELNVWQSDPGVVQFVVDGKEFDDDEIFTIYVDSKLNMYINSIKEENKTSIEELVHDIYLRLTEKNKKVFESSSLYSEITHSDLNNSIFGIGNNESHISEEFIIENWEEFSDNEISEILNFFPNDIFEIYSYIDGEIVKKNLGEAIGKSTGELCITSIDRTLVIARKPAPAVPTMGYIIDLTVVKLKDEWYYVTLPGRGFNNFKMSKKLSTTHWKCDQFYGLIEFIKNLVK